MIRIASASLAIPLARNVNMPVIDDDVIQDLVTENLRKLPLSPEEIERITPELSKHYYFLKDQKLKEDVKQQFFNYKQRINKAINFDTSSEIKRLSNFKSSLTKIQTLLLRSYNKSHFKIREYITKEDLISLVSEEPQLLVTSPEKIGKNFAALGCYLYANELNHPVDSHRKNFKDTLAEIFLKNPKLFIHSYQLSIANIETVQKYFESKDRVDAIEANKWLNEKITFFENFVRENDFRKIALYDEPRILLQNPQITINNVEEVSRRFAHVGLTDFGYLQAIKRLPELLVQPPKVTINHINTITRNLARPNFSIEKHRNIQQEYIKLGVYHPELFSPSSDLSQRFCLIYRAYENGYFSTATKTDNESLEALTNMLLKNKKYFGKNSDEILLKQILIATGIAAEDLNTKSKFLRSSTNKLEEKCFNILGHPDKSKPVQKKHSLKLDMDERKKHYPFIDLPVNRLLPVTQEIKQSKSNYELPNEQEQADNLLLRTLIRAGLLKGQLDKE